MDENVVLHRDPELAEEMAANAVIYYLQECDLREQSARRDWVERVFARVISKKFTQ